MEQLIYRSGCWTCKRANEDPQQQYVCPKVQQHWTEYKKKEKEYL